MNVDGVPYRTIWLADDGETVEIIDQTRLPHDFVVARLTTLEDAAHAIRAMLVRGAPLIGATAAYGLCLAIRADASDASLDAAYETLIATRPTAVNLRWALDDMRDRLGPLAPGERRAAAYQRAAEICDEDVAINRAIGRKRRRADPPGPPTVGAGRQHTDPLQCGLAGDRGLGHGFVADLSRARGRHPGPCLGRRDAAAQPGASLTRVGAGRPRRAAYGDRRQRRRPSDAARRGRSRHHRDRPHHGERRCVQQDRDLSEGACGARQRGAVLRRAAGADHRLVAGGRPATYRSNSAPPRR